MALVPLPSSREFITQLINSLPALPPPPPPLTASDAPPPNPLTSAPDPLKKQLLALHVLFPNELLPALDLLDRQLVTRFRIRRDPARGHTGAHVVNEAVPQEDTVSRSDNTAAIPVPRFRHGQDQVQVQRHSEQHVAVAQASAAQVDAASAFTSGAIRGGPMDAPDAEMLDSGSAADAQGLSSGGSRVLGAAQEEQRVHDVRADAAQQEQEQEQDTVYYVRSAQQRSSRYSASYDATATYEVRLQAWNCSCPAFAFAAFPAVHPEPAVPILEHRERDGNVDAGTAEGENGRAWIFGGVGLGEATPPVCKHLLACVLVERCAGMFGGFVKEEEVSAEEAAGWAAGWGD
ncbi:hypothetical protein BDV95DRAFT_612433 [Massariosphaeria phaeospora]|uniref:SWIM-type domain-containing protein n=1 Tax=Massariosphaeria phaeospora TaxID=100035 RepID=A0A7C8I2X9_9PLEO|nr:hypothetical protein BDV95DRAFT_612433 [Massariosphaeria phaeospora]